MDDRLKLLARANAREILAAFRLDRLGRLQPMAEWLASFPARRLSRQILQFDEIVRRHGLAAGSRNILDEFTSGAIIEGREHVPRCGPLLAVSNHPGVVDAMAICVALERRSDLKIIASDREILRLLPGISSRLLFVEPGAGGRAGLLREAARHLGQGGSLLNFPAGTIEPDPQLRTADTLGDWSSSSELLVRLVPETVVLPLAVSGVISRAAHRHPMARRFADPAEREWAAATLQVLCRHLRRAEVRIVIGEPVSLGDGSQGVTLRSSMAALLARASGPFEIGTRDLPRKAGSRWTRPVRNASADTGDRRVTSATSASDTVSSEVGVVAETASLQAPDFPLGRICRLDGHTV
jgi:Acyltransferase